MTGTASRHALGTHSLPPEFDLGSDGLPLRLCLLWALCASVGLGLILGISVSPHSLANPDDIMRLVSVRDLLAGQGWFDTHQYRLGLDEGTAMHWSRLVDAPIALLVLLGDLITGSGEAFAAWVWPSLVAFLGLTAVALSANRLGGRALVAIAVFVGGLTYYSMGVFTPGSFDHHNLQTALGLWMIYGLIPDQTQRHTRTAWIAGLAAAAMIAIGIEGLPFVAFTGSWVALSLLTGMTNAQRAADFGLSFALASGALFLVLLGPSGLASQTCDAFSTFHLTLAAIGGFGLFATARWLETNGGRAIGLGLTAAVATTAILIAFDHCLQNPFATIPEIVRIHWLDGVVETASVMDRWQSDPFSLVSGFGMALAAVVAGTFWFSTTRHMRASAGLVLAMVLAGFAISLWQQRGATFMFTFAILPMAWAIMRARMIGSTSLVVLTWLASANVFWIMLGDQMAHAFGEEPTLSAQIRNTDTSDLCGGPGTYDGLAALPVGRVLATSNYGPNLLADTPHHVIAGPYHRNIDGMTMMIETMLAPLEQAHFMLDVHAVDYVALCLTGAEERIFARDNPIGLSATVATGQLPEWLEPIESANGDANWRVFAVHYER